MPNNILIVDDEVKLTQLLEQYFQIKGYNVLTAADGGVALNLIRDNAPSLVLLDMKLPSLDGLEILKILRKDYPDTKVIVMTAYDAEYKKEIDLVGYDAFFIKPIPFEELKDTVEGLLSGKIPRKPEAKVISKDILKEPKPLVEDKENFLPKARIAIVETRETLASLLKNYLERGVEDVRYTVLKLTHSSLSSPEEIQRFSPDIVLYDIIEIGNFSDFALRVMNLTNPPKEIILFGDPKFKWEEVDLLVKRGMSYIPTPLSPANARLSNIPWLEIPSKETIERLAGVIKGVCFKHGLVTKKGEETHA